MPNRRISTPIPYIPKLTWKSWSPTIDLGSSPPGGCVATPRYTHNGKTVIFHIHLALTDCNGTTSISISIPTSWQQGLWYMAMVHVMYGFGGNYYTVHDVCLLGPTSFIINSLALPASGGADVICGGIYEAVNMP